jgi:hypothetical protein
MVFLILYKSGVFVYVVVDLYPCNSDTIEHYRNYAWTQNMDAKGHEQKKHTNISCAQKRM